MPLVQRGDSVGLIAVREDNERGVGQAEAQVPISLNHCPGSDEVDAIE